MWRWWPSVLPTLACLTVLAVIDVSLRDVLVWAAFYVLAVCLPGVLVWRALRKSSHNVAEEICGGTATGLAIFLFGYLAVLAVGIPQFALVVPALVVVMFFVIPRLRQFWRGTYDTTVPRWFAWSVSVVVLLAVAWLAWRAFPTHPFTGEVAGFPYIDHPYQLALAGELKNHLPPETPYVAGEPLGYHWFFHAHLAGTSWATGIELEVLLWRFAFLPLMALFMVALAITTVRLCSGAEKPTNRHWAVGLLTLVLAFFLTTFSPFQWSDGPIFMEGRLLADWWWYSPTHTFGAALFAVAALLLIDLLREKGSSQKGTWALLVLLLAVIVGAKSTYIPIAAAGMCLVLAVSWWRTKRISHTALIALGVCVGLFLLASLLLYEGGAGGLHIRPMGQMHLLPVGWYTQLRPPFQAVPLWILPFIGILTLSAWLMRSSGIVGLIDKKRISDEALVWLAGVCLAGLAATFTFTHSGTSQYYFSRAVMPYVAVLSAWGFMVLFERARKALSSKQLWVGVTGATVGGIVITWLVTLPSGTHPPRGPQIGNLEVLIRIMWPFAALAAVSVVAWVILRRTSIAVATSLLIATAIAATGIFGLGQEIVSTSRKIKTEGLATPWVYPTWGGDHPLPIPAGGREGARWLRDHSEPTDLIATNSHCHGYDAGKCDNRHFWISAYTERRVLVEGWGYAARTSDNVGNVLFKHRPFWNSTTLAVNDAAFTSPTTESLVRLADYGVKWLFVSADAPADISGLRQHAKLMHRSGNIYVFAL